MDLAEKLIESKLQESNLSTPVVGGIGQWLDHDDLGLVVVEDYLNNGDTVLVKDLRGDFHEVSPDSLSVVSE